MKEIFIMIASFVLLSCADGGHLRGSVEPSKDGKTYFGVIDDNGGQCGPLLLDGEPWVIPVGEVAPIKPGAHELHCGATIGFIVPEGVVYKFDYWGP